VEKNKRAIALADAQVARHEARKKWLRENLEENKCGCSPDCRVVETTVEGIEELFQAVNAVDTLKGETK
jgi:hypothetical protein